MIRTDPSFFSLVSATVSVPLGGTGPIVGFFGRSYTGLVNLYIRTRNTAGAQTSRLGTPPPGLKSVEWRMAWLFKYMVVLYSTFRAWKTSWLKVTIFVSTRDEASVARSM